MKPRLKQPNAFIILLALALLSLTNEAGAQQAGVNNEDTDCKTTEEAIEVEKATAKCPRTLSEVEQKVLQEVESGRPVTLTDPKEERRTLSACFVVQLLTNNKKVPGGGITIRNAIIVARWILSARRSGLIRFSAAANFAV